MTLPVISLWNPWAIWVAKGWKTIETRTHSRFKSLIGKRIGIHAVVKWDKNALETAAPYLVLPRKQMTANWLKVGGSLIATAHVDDHRLLHGGDSVKALIDCWDTLRYGLILSDIQVLKESIPMKGRQGIWYVEVDL